MKAHALFQEVEGVVHLQLVLWNPRVEVAEVQPLEALVVQVVEGGQGHDHQGEEVAAVLHGVVAVALQLKEVVEEVGLHGLEEEVALGHHDLEEEVEVGHHYLEEEVVEVGLLHAWEEEEVVEAGLRLHILEEEVAMENHVDARVVEEVGLMDEHHDEGVVVVVMVEMEVESHD